MFKFFSSFIAVLVAIFLFVSSPVLAIGDGSILSNLGSGNLGSNVGSGEVLSQLGSNAGSGSLAQQVQTFLDGDVSYAELQSQIVERLDTAMARNEAAVEAINTSSLDDHDKEQITQALTLLGEQLSQYQEDVQATQSLAELYELHLEVKAYVQENQTIVQDAVVEATIQLAGYAVESMDDFFLVVETFLFSEALTSCNTQEGLEAYYALFDSLDTLEVSLFALSSTVYGYGQEIEETQEGAFLYDTEDILLLSSLVDGTVNSDTDLDGTMDLTLSASGNVFLNNTTVGYTVESIDEENLKLTEDSQTIIAHTDGTVEISGATKAGRAFNNSDGGKTQLYNTGLSVSTNSNGDVAIFSPENKITIIDGVIVLTDTDGILITVQASGISVVDIWNNQIEISDLTITTTDTLGSVILYENGAVTVTHVATENLIANVENQMAQVKLDAQAVLEDVAVVYNTCSVSTQNQEETGE